MYSQTAMLASEGMMVAWLRKSGFGQPSALASWENGP